MAIQLISIIPNKAQDFINACRASQDKTEKRTVSVKKSSNPTAAIIPVKGYAYDVDCWQVEWGMGFSYDGIERMIDEALANGVKTILFDIDTPGGCGIGAESLVEKIYSLREQGVRTIAQVHNVCCSAGYRLASQCEEIYAPNDALVGCLGTYTVVYDDSEAYKKEGIKTILISSGGIKGVGSRGTEITEEYQKILRKQVDVLNDQFKEEVKRGRNLSTEQTDELFTGETWLGKQALAKGLIDKRQTLTQTLKMLVKENSTMSKDTEEKTPSQQTAETPVVVTVAELDNLKMASDGFKLDCIRKGMTADQAKQSYLEYLECENKSLREQLESRPQPQPEETKPTEKEEKIEEEAPLTIPGNVAAVNTGNLEVKKTATEIVNELAKKYAEENGVDMSDAVYAVLHGNATLTEKYMEETNG